MMGHLEARFPGLRGMDYRINSPGTDAYNCIAWAVGSTDSWWWPGDPELTYWPAGVARTETLPAFHEALASLGYLPCADASYEPDSIKIALFANADSRPTHAARQLPNGRWTSKLGMFEDIEHDLRDLAGAEYGTVVQIMKRPEPASRVA